MQSFNQRRGGNVSLSLSKTDYKVAVSKSRFDRLSMTHTALLQSKEVLL